MCLRQRGLAILFSQMIVAVGIRFPLCAVIPARLMATGTIGCKEWKMESQPDSKNPQKFRPPIRETVGATSAPFELGKGITTVSLEVHTPTGPALLRSDGQKKRVLLRVQNIRSMILAPPFDIYLNLPAGEDAKKHPELHAGTLSTFGLVEASKTKGNHPGNGLSFSEDVTELFFHLVASRDWDGKTLRVSFAPSPWGDYPIKVEVGRVSLMME